MIVPTYLSVVEEYTTAFRSPQVAIDCNIASSSELSGLAGDGTRGAASIANTLVRHSLMRSNQAIVVITATTTNPNNLTWHPRCVGGRRCVSWRWSDARWRGLPCCIGCTKSAHGGTSLNDALKPSYCCHYSHNNIFTYDHELQPHLACALSLRLRVFEPHGNHTPILKHGHP